MNWEILQTLPGSAGETFGGQSAVGQALVGVVPGTGIEPVRP